MTIAPSPPPLAVRRVAGFHDDPHASAREFDARVERWREEVVKLDLYEVEGLRRGFHFDWDVVELPGASLLRFDATGLTYDRDERRTRRDGIDTVRVQLTTRGGFRGRLGGVDVVAGPGTAVFCDQTRPFHNRSADTRGLTLSLPRAAFGGADVRGLHGRIVSGAAFRRLGDYADWLFQAAPKAPAASAERAVAAMGAVVRATFERGGGEAEAELQDGGALDGMTVARLRALACAPRGIGDGDAAALAARLGVSRAALYRATAPYGGVMELVWEERLQAAHAALCDPARPEPIGAIALALGFGSPHHFSRRFRARFGVSPSDLRPFRLDRAG